VTAVLGLADCLLDKWSNNSFEFWQMKNFAEINDNF
jgi:hypothetical protein